MKNLIIRAFEAKKRKFFTLILALVAGVGTVLAQSNQACIDYLDLNQANCYVNNSNPQDTRTFNNFRLVSPVDSGSASMASRHTVHLDTTETDLRTGGMAKTVPTGALGSVRLGNWDAGNQAERIEYSFVVDTAHPILLVKYLPILEAPRHDDAENPRFKIDVLVNGQSIGMCGQLDVNANDIYNGSALTPEAIADGWHITPAATGQLSADIVWKDWTTMGICFESRYHGQTVTVRLTTYDCTFSAHCGYAYFTLGCSDVRLKNNQDGASYSILEAPEGFDYRWAYASSDRYRQWDGSLPEQYILSRSQVLEAGYNGDSLYVVDCMFKGDTSCFFSLYGSAQPAEPQPCLIASGYCGAEVDSTNLRWELGCDSVLTISGIGEMRDYQQETIPWEEYKSAIRDVRIGDNVTTIGNYAFCDPNHFYKLTSVTIPNSVRSIGNYAFYACDKLATITNSDSLITIGNQAFAFCSNLKSIMIPNSVTNIGTSAFYSCDALTAINVADNNPNYCSVDGVLFNKNKTALIQYPGGKLGAYTIPNGVKNWGNTAFMHCQGLTSVEIPNSFTSIAYHAFCGCSNLTSVTIPNSVTSIGEEAFRDCSRLSSALIPNSVISIGNQAFANCTGLTSVSIPNSVTSIGEGAFYRISGLTSFDIASDNPNYCSVDGVLFDKNITTLIQCPGGKQGAYTIPNGVKEILAYAFLGCENLTSVIISDSVTSIGNCAFSGCSNLTSVTIPNSVYSIGNSAFYDCSSLTSIEIPIGVTSINQWAFAGCSNLTSITNHAATPQWINSNTFTYTNDNPAPDKSIPLYVQAKSIEAYRAANVWREFTNIQPIPDLIASGYCGAEGYTIIWELSSDSVLTISGTGYINDFDNQYNSAPWYYTYKNTIKSVKINEGVTYIGRSSFENCSRIENISIPNSVTQIEARAFFGCSIDSVVIPDGVKIIGSGAFAYCTFLTSIDIPNSVESIGDCAFQECNRLTSITLPERITKIESYIFSNCTNLTSVNIPEGVLNIKNYAFADCSSLTSIEIPQSVSGIGPYAFSGCENLSTIYNYADTPQDITNMVFDNSTAHARVNKQTCVLYVPAGSIELYQAANVWKGFTNILPIEDPVAPPCLIASGYCGAEGDSTNLRWELSCDSVMTISGTGEMAEYGTNPWSENNESIRTVIIENGVTTIAAYAFNACNSLTSVEIPNSVTSIGNNVFTTCSALTSIIVDSNNPNYCSIDGVLFNKEKTLLIQYPRGRAGSYAVPNTVTSIGERAFYNCRNLTLIEIPNSVTSIGYYTFYNCNRLTSIEIPNSVRSIGERAFYNCKNILSVVIGDNVSAIEAYTFADCRQLKTLSFGASIASIGKEALKNCDSLSTIICYAINPPTLGNNRVFDSANKSACLLYVPAESIFAYQQAEGWGQFTNIRPIGGIDPSIYIDGCIDYIDIAGPNVICTYGYNPAGNPNRSPYDSIGCINQGADQQYSRHTVHTDTTELDPRTDNMLHTVPEGAVASVRLGNWRADGEAESITYSFVPDTTDNDILIINYAVVLEKDDHPDGTSFQIEVLDANDRLIDGTCAHVFVTSADAQEAGWNTANSGQVFWKDWTKMGVHLAHHHGQTVKIRFTTSDCAWGGHAAYAYLTLDCTSSKIQMNKGTGSSCTTLKAPDGFSYTWFDETNTIVSTDQAICVDATQQAYICRVSHIEQQDCYFDISSERIVPKCLIASGYCGAEVDSTNLRWELGCDSVLTISGSGNMANYTSSSGNRAPWYDYNKEIVAINLPDSLGNIGSRAFYGCRSVRSISIPNNVTAIGDMAFYECSELLSIVIPNSVLAIGSRAFQSCSSLLSIIVNGNNPYYDSRNNCNAIIETETNTIISGAKTTVIPNSVRIIGDYAFYGCKYDSLYIPDSVISIGKYAYAHSYSLSSVVIGNGVSTIGQRAFNECPSLTAITFGSSVTTIEKDAFTHCTAINTIISHAVTPPYLQQGVKTFNYVDKSIPLYVPAQSVEAYQQAEGWNQFTNIQPIGGELEPRYPIFVHLYDSIDSRVIETAMIHCDTALFYDFNNGRYLVYAYQTARNQWTLQARTTPRYYVRYWLTPDYVSANDTLFLSLRDTTDVTLVVSPRSYSIHLYSDSYEHGSVRTSDWYASSDTSFYMRYADTTNIEAIPHEGYRFVRWSDGNTDNPRTIRVTQDMTLEAIFDSTETPIPEPTSITCAEAASYMPEESGATTETEYTVAGYITSTNGVLSISNADPSIYRQTFYMDDARGTAKTLQGYYCNLPGNEPLNVGDRITLTGKITNYRNQPEIMNGDVVILERAAVVMDTIDATVCEALDACASLSAGDYSTDIFRVYGRVKGADKVSNGLHTFDMACGERVFRAYRCINAAVAEFDKGDSVVIIGKLYNYGGVLMEISGGTVELIEKAPSIYELTTQPYNPDYGYTTPSDTMVNKGDTILIQAIPYEGYQFICWSDGNTSNPREVTITENTTFTAIFRQAVLNEAQMWPVILDDYTAQNNQQYIVGDFRKNDVDNFLYIWAASETYDLQTATGLNYFQNDGGYTSLRVVAPDGWSGGGFFVSNSISLAMMQLLKDSIVAHPDDYYLHIAIKSNDNASHGFYFLENQFGFSIGSTPINGEAVLTDFPRDGEWHSLYIPLAPYANDLAAYTLTETGVNAFCFLSGNAVGAELNLDAVYFCNTAFMSMQTPCPMASGTCGEHLTWELSCDSVLTISGYGEMTDWNPYAYPWNEYKSIIKSVVISDSVTHIGRNAFYEFAAMTTVNLPENVISIGEGAFEGCSSLPVVDHLRYVGTYLVEAADKTLNTYTIREGTKWIGSRAFSECTMTSISIPNSVTEIQGAAFYRCNSLTSIVLPNGLTRIARQTFLLCDSLRSVVIPNSVTEIDYEAFEDCRSLESIVIPDSVTYIWYGAFAGCRSLTSVTIPSSVLEFSYNPRHKDAPAAFAGCTGLAAINVSPYNPNYCSIDGVVFTKNVQTLIQYPGGKQGAYTIPDGVRVIEEWAFSECYGLTSVTIPNSVLTLKDFAFSYCYSLSSVTLPNSIDTLGYGVFESCSGLTSITCEAVYPPALDDDVFYGVDKSIPLYIPAESIELYRAAEQWRNFTNILPIPRPQYTISVAVNDSIYGSAYGAGTFTKDSIVLIWATPNYGCHFTRWSDGNRTNPRRIEVTQDSAFIAYFAVDRSGYCGDSLALMWEYDATAKALTISGNGALNSNYTFGVEAPNAVENLIIAEGVTAIGQRAFANYTTIKHISIPTTVTRIREEAFYDCVGLEEIYSYRERPCVAYSNTFDGIDKFECTLHVLSASVNMYQVATGWSEFYYIETIDAQTVTEVIEEVETVPADNNVTITWPVSEGAETYTIEVSKNGVVVCRLIFGADGQLLGIAFAPGRHGGPQAPAAVKTENGGLRFTITGLESGTDYQVTVIAKDANEEVVEEYTSDFTTSGAEEETPTDIDQIESSSLQGGDRGRLIFRDGQFFILRGDKVYTIDGRLVK